MNSNVIVYTSKGCTYCEQVVDFFRKERINVDQRNISESEESFKEWKEINPIGTPLTCYKDHIVVGFHKKNLQAIVDLYHSS
ncbi:glutaredoxin family protein [Salipaludibacillus daqingensis]|uniref:glutaredoxin family protein n=1 Tax=Salipaludibacillus daqingensis TaxID=3041001 RepID=UPI002475DA59|nr:glutaredoxin family protein [Salipaludibacillus daqingensis]